MPRTIQVGKGSLLTAAVFSTSSGMGTEYDKLNETNSYEVEPEEKRKIL